MRFPLLPDFEFRVVKRKGSLTLTLSRGERGLEAKALEAKGNEVDSELMGI